jgi:molybdate transport system substrate-binding protein
MTRRSLAVLSAVLFAHTATAQDSSLHVVASNGVRAVIEELFPKAEAAVGRKLSVEYNSTTGLKQKIDAGQTFDVAILTSEGVDDLIKAGKIAARTRTDFARCGVGVGIRAGAPKPDIRTSEALKQTLLKAKSITYAEDGASRAYVNKMLDRFGIAEEIGRKTAMEQGSTRATARVASGRSDIVLTLVSEILPAPGVLLVGPLPADVQGYVTFTAGIGANSKDVKAGQALIQFLKSPAVAPTLKSKGMESR